MRMQRTLMAWSLVEHSLRRIEHCSSMLRITLRIELELVRFDHKTAKTGFGSSQAKCERVAV